MKHFQTRILQVGLLALFTACFAHLAAAQGIDWNKEVDGFKIHLGVQPANMVPAAIKNPHESVPSRKDSYHLVIVLFDASSGKPVEGAQVKATVGEIGLSGVRKTMEPLKTKKGANYYGNFFTMLPGRGPYRIAVEIRGIKDHGQVDTVFEYKP